MTLTLPTVRTKPSLSLGTAKTLIYGPPKIGKSTLAATLNPDHTLFLAAEPGLGGLEVFQQRVRTWEEFRQAGEALATEDHDFKLVVVDTVDALSEMCDEYVLRELNLRLKKPIEGYLHPSDFEYGKGWRAASDEFKLRVAKLCSLGMGVVFISHANEKTAKDRTGRELTQYAPQIGQKGSREWLVGFVDYIALARAEDGKRVLRTKPTEQYEAGGRIELPDPLPLDAGALRSAIEEATKT